MNAKTSTKALLMTGTLLALCTTIRTAAAPNPMAKDIVENAMAAGDLSTLVKALDAADLVEALKGKGPFTVFAPTDQAFAKLPEGKLDELLKPENKQKLRMILEYHVVGEKLNAKEVKQRSGALTLCGQKLDFCEKDEKVMVDNACVTKADVKCKNGVIHVIDTVVMPASDNLVETAKKAQKFNTLLTAATKAGLADTLATGGPFTLFAPTDEAFAKLPPGKLEELLAPENREELANLLKCHLVSGRVYANEAVAAKQAKALSGCELKIKEMGKEVRVARACVVTPDLDASNGVIHVIDRVILPEDVE